MSVLTGTTSYGEVSQFKIFGMCSRDSFFRQVAYAIGLTHTPLGVSVAKYCRGVAAGPARSAIEKCVGSLLLRWQNQQQQPRLLQQPDDTAPFVVAAGCPSGSSVNVAGPADDAATDAAAEKCVGSLLLRWQNQQQQPRLLQQPDDTAPFVVAAVCPSGSSVNVAGPADDAATDAAAAALAPGGPGEAAAVVVHASGPVNAAADADDPSPAAPFAVAPDGPVDAPATAAIDHALALLRCENQQQQPQPDHTAPFADAVLCPSSGSVNVAATADDAATGAAAVHLHASGPVNVTAGADDPALAAPAVSAAAVAAAAAAATAAGAGATGDTAVVAAPDAADDEEEDETAQRQHHHEQQHQQEQQQQQQQRFGLSFTRTSIPRATPTLQSSSSQPDTSHTGSSLSCSSSSSSSSSSLDQQRQQPQQQQHQPRFCQEQCRGFDCPFATAEAVQSHCSLEHPKRQGCYQCVRCPYSVGTSLTLKRHLLINHEVQSCQCLPRVHYSCVQGIGVLPRALGRLFRPTTDRARARKHAAEYVPERSAHTTHTCALFTAQRCFNSVPILIQLFISPCPTVRRGPKQLTFHPTISEPLAFMLCLDHFWTHFQTQDLAYVVR